MTIEWNGVVTKPVPEAGWATTNRIAELETWKYGNILTRLTATVSGREVLELQRLLSDIGGFKPGPWPPGTYTQEYIIEITTGTAHYHKELGFTKKLVPLLERIKACLHAEAQPPLDKIIEHAEGWQR
jgi:hypothetical protein